MATTTSSTDTCRDINSGSGEMMVFERFKKFPPEIRRKIWKEACHFQRFIELYGHNDAQTVVGDFLHDNINEISFEWSVWKSYNGVPALLHASHEARDVGLENYTLEFGSRWQPFKGPLTSVTLEAPPQIYVNWTCDAICPMNYLVPERFSDLMSKPLKYLAFSSCEGARHFDKDFQFEMPTLKEIWLYAYELEEEYWEHSPKDITLGFEDLILSRSEEAAMREELGWDIQSRHYVVDAAEKITKRLKNKKGPGRPRVVVKKMTFE